MHEGQASRFILPILLIATLAALPIYFKERSSWRRIYEHQRAVLYKTDDERLLSACRDLWQRHQLGQNVDVSVDHSLPEIISRLEPHDLSCSASGVEIELGGQGCHYGFEAFFSDPKADPSRTVWKTQFPCKQLSPELWYYAENGVLDPAPRQ